MRNTIENIEIKKKKHPETTIKGDPSDCDNIRISFRI